MANQLERTSKPHALTLATLERALRARRLDHTLTSALPPLERTDPSVLAATDIAALDACLQPAAPAQTIAHVRLEKSALGAPGVDGGLPRGQLSEIVGPRSSGRTLLLHQVMAAATRRGELAALVDTLDQFDVGSAVSAGVDLDRLLWIRGQTIRTSFCDKPRSYGGTEKMLIVHLRVSVSGPRRLWPVAGEWSVPSIAPSKPSPWYCRPAASAWWRSIWPTYQSLR